jgi:hypothetical protein
MVNEVPAASDGTAANVSSRFLLTSTFGNSKMRFCPPGAALLGFAVSRASTSCFLVTQQTSMTRDKPGHDGCTKGGVAVAFFVFAFR